METFWESLCAGKSGVGPITLFDPVDHGTKIAGEVKDFNPEDQLDSRTVKYMDRYSQFAVCAAPGTPPPNPAQWIRKPASSLERP